MLKKFFGKDAFLENQATNSQILENIQSGISFKGSNLWILLCSIVVCCAGLNMNSTAVVIGAMLLSPLMGPILGIGAGLARQTENVIFKALKNLVVAILTSLLLATIYFYFSPIANPNGEIMARISPNLWDGVIAIFGGIAGAIGLSRKNPGNVIPGVSIATALMPPICVGGFWLSQGNIDNFLKAFYLLFMNITYISISTFLVLKIIGFGTHKTGRFYNVLIGIIFVLAAIPGVFLTKNFIVSTQAKTEIEGLKKYLAEKNIPVLDIKYNGSKNSLEIFSLQNNDIKLEDYLSQLQYLKDADYKFVTNQENTDYLDNYITKKEFIDLLEKQNQTNLQSQAGLLFDAQLIINNKNVLVSGQNLDKEKISSWLKLNGYENISFSQNYQILDIFKKFFSSKN